MSTQSQPFLTVGADVTVTRREWLAAVGGAAAVSMRADAREEMRQSPPLTVYVSNESKLELQRHRGRVILLDFMTTTCPACKKASGEMEKLYRDLRKDGLLAVGVVLNFTSFPDLDAYRQQHRLTFPIGAAPRERITEYLQHPAHMPIYVPVIVTIDRQMRIRDKHLGWKGEDKVRQQLRELLRS